MKRQRQGRQLPANGVAKRPRTQATGAGGRRPQPSISSAICLAQSLNLRLIDEWIHEYEDNSDEAIVKILNFFISATGCKGTVTSIMIKSMEFKNIIANLSKDFDDDTNDYPLIMTGNQYKKFRQNFGEFILMFVAKVKSGIIFDEAFTDNVLQLLTGLAESQIRAFRHTATFAAMKFSSAMVDVVVDLVDVKEKTGRQIETEKTKLKQRTTNERMDALLATKAELETKVNELCLMIQFVFKSVFAHRYRDTVSDIRCICISELGNWIRAYPVLFLEDSYLKYIGWSLFDKFAEVRLRCVSVLLPLYETPHLVQRMELFTSKFKDRLVSMVTDKDIDVAVKSCHLITQIHRAFPTLLELKDCVPIYETVYCTNRPLAVAAGSFLSARLFNAVDENGETVEHKVHFQRLVAFFIEGEVHNHSAYLVDALMEYNPFLKDWTTMCELLLSDDSIVPDSQLIDIMVCAVKQAATGEPPVVRQSAKRATGAAAASAAAVAVAKDPRVLKEERTRITEAFIPALPRLINKFVADAEKVTALTSIPQFFELDIYSSGRYERPLSDLMTALDRVFEQHSDEEILKNVVSVLHYFTTQTAVNQLTETPRTQLIDKFAVQFRQSAQRSLTDDTLDEEDEAEVLSSFRKVTALALVFEIRLVDIWETTLNVLSNARRFTATDIVDKGVSLLFYILCHEVQRLIGGSETKSAISKLKKHRDEFLAKVRQILEQSASSVEQAFFCLCDTLVLFNYKIAESSDRAADLLVQLDTRFINVINTFVVNNVFEVSQEEFDKLDEQSKVELTCKRRVVLGQYGKLVMVGMMPITDIALVLRYYVSDYNDYGDILKQIITRCRDIDRMAVAQAMIRALKAAFEEVRAGEGRSQNDAMEVDGDETVSFTASSPDFAELRDLAKRFAAFFGTEQTKNREAVALIHQMGIRIAFALDTPQRGRKKTTAPKDSLAFLEILAEFSTKLLRHDKTAVLKYLVEHSDPPRNFAESDRWAPFVIYKNSLSR